MKSQIRSLTARYSLHQAVYCAACCGVISFAAAYLLSRGFTAARIGGILFAANFFSFLFQPVLAGFADRQKAFLLPQIMCICSVFSSLCFLLICFLQVSDVLLGGLYFLGILFLDIQLPLLNSVSVFYPMRGWGIDYGIGRGIGALGYAGASIGFGLLMERCGAAWMPGLSILLMGISAVLSVTYPKAGAVHAGESGGAEQNGCTLFRFFLQYGWYTASLCGILLLAFVHLMTENYLIEIIGCHGGSSSHAGFALFLASFVEIPAMMLFSRIHRRFGTYKILLTAGAAYLLKMVLFTLARSITAIYLIQLLQAASYAMLAPVQVCYARESVPEPDLIKGQSVMTAAYSLGGAFGNLLGGAVITAFGVPSMLKLAAAVSAAGLGILFFTVPAAIRRRGG